MERTRAGAESRSNHIVDDIRHARGVAVPGALHELLHEGESQTLLHGRHGQTRGIRRRIAVVVPRLFLLLSIFPFGRSEGVEADGPRIAWSGKRR